MCWRFRLCFEQHMSMIKIGIIGGAGYTAGELIRLLRRHEAALLCSVVSSSSAGQKVSDIHDDLLGDVEDLRFCAELTGTEDLVFLCLGHGISREWISTHQEKISPTTRIIDLGNDFRLQADSAFMGRDFVYGLPELQRERIAQAQNIANPGCFATAIQLALLPLAQAGLLKQTVHVSAITGSTGAGRSMTEHQHFSWRNNNVSIYKPLRHQHLDEIRQSLAQVAQAPSAPEVLFVPYRGNFTRGIFASVYTPFEGTLQEAQSLYADYYAAHPFTHLSEKEIHLKQVVGSNKCLLHLDVHAGQLLISSAIDNLLKGASGQAVQNMNLMFGLEETTGL